MCIRDRPHIDGDWHPSIAEDYDNARDDDERRHILLKEGYDQAHKSEVKRLFDEPLELEKKKEEEKHQEIRKKVKERRQKIRTIVLDIFAAVAFLASIPAAVQFIRWLCLLYTSRCV